MCRAAGGRRGLVRAVPAVPVARRHVARQVAVAVTDPIRGAAVIALRHGPREIDLLTSAASEEVVGPHIATEHDVIVQVQELVAQTFDAVQMRLDRGR